MIQIINESRKLNSLREMLLPKLMSGEIKVNNTPLIFTNK